MSTYVGRHRLEDLFYESHFVVKPDHPSAPHYPGKHANPLARLEALIARQNAMLGAWGFLR